MRTVVWVPFRGDGAWRTKNFEAVQKQVFTLGYPVWVHDSNDQPFSIARTWNDLGSRDGWDVALCWGADFLLVDPESAHAAVREVVDGGKHYVFAFDKVSTLGPTETRAVHRGEVRAFRESRLPFGGVRAISRRMWERVGGYDARFSGWGHEDRAHVHGYRLLYGERHRVPGHMLNLWHPKRSTEKQTLAERAYFAQTARNAALWREIQQIDTPEGWDAYLADRGD